MRSARGSLRALVESFEIRELAGRHPLLQQYRTEFVELEEQNSPRHLSDLRPAPAAVIK
jgi:hypothetical protein